MTNEIDYKKIKSAIDEYRFVNYSSGCPCNGLPRFYKNEKYPDYKIVTKSGYGIIKKGGVQIFKTRDPELFEEKLKELFEI